MHDDYNGSHHSFPNLIQNGLESMRSNGGKLHSTKEHIVPSSVLSRKSMITPFNQNQLNFTD